MYLIEHGFCLLPGFGFNNAVRQTLYLIGSGQGLTNT